MSPAGSDNEEWRQRESNQPSSEAKCAGQKELTNTGFYLSGKIGVPDWLNSTSADASLACGSEDTLSLQHVASAWPDLQRHIREAIITLIDAALSQERLEGGQS